MIVAEVDVSDGHGRVCSEQVQVHVRETDQSGIRARGQAVQEATTKQFWKKTKVDRNVHAVGSSHAKSGAFQCQGGLAERMVDRVS